MIIFKRKQWHLLISSPSYPYNVFLIVLLIICFYFRHEYQRIATFFFSKFQLLLKITATKDWRMKEAPNRGHFPTSTQLIPNDNSSGAQIEEILHKCQTFFLHFEIYQNVLINRSWHLDIKRHQPFISDAPLIYWMFQQTLSQETPIGNWGYSYTNKVNNYFVVFWSL